MSNTMTTDRPDWVDPSLPSNNAAVNDTAGSRGSNAAQPEHTSLWAGAKQALSSFASISEFLRLLGGIGVLLSMSLFLLQGWAETNDFQRFCMMIAQTGLLSFAGFSMYKWLRETKSARLFFGLSLVSVTVNFTTLAALIYSVFSWDNLAADYPKFAHWVASDIGSVLLSMALSVVILLPLAWLAFSILVRPAAKVMTLAYVAVNVLLLLPVRETGITVVLAIGAAAVLGKYLATHLRTADLGSVAHGQDLNLATFSWRTREARFAQLVLFLPLVIMLVRGFMHYQIDTFSVVAMATAVYFFAVYSANIVTQRFMSLLHCIALSAALLVATQVAFFGEWLNTYSGLQLPVFALLFCAAILDVLRRTTSRAMQVTLRYLGPLCAVVSVGLNHLIQHDGMALLIAVVTGGLVSVWGYKMRSYFATVAGLLLVTVLLFSEMSGVLMLIMSSGWLGLAIAGVSVIVLASLLDRYGAIVRLKWSQRRESLQEWH